MAENAPQTSPETPETDENVEPTRLQVFVNKHPRAAKITAIVGGVTAVAGAVHFTRTVQSNRAHVQQAGDHAKEALTELSTAVSPTDTEA